MRVLLTGGDGFIGRNLQLRLGERHEVLAPHRSELDLLDDGAVRRWLADRRVDAIVHSATIPGHRNAPPAPDLGMRNLRMFFSLALHSSPSTRVVVLGSGAEYDVTRMEPRAKEESAGRFVPADDTGLSKLVMSLHAERDPRCVHLRPFGVFGPHEDWEIRFVSNAICKALFDRPVTLRQNRRLDYIWVEDLAAVVEHVLVNDMPHRTYNVTPDEMPDLLTLARLVLDVAGKDLPIRMGAPGLGPEYTGDNTRLRSAIPGLSLTPLREAVTTLWGWYSGRREFIRPEALEVDK